MPSAWSAGKCGVDGLHASHHATAVRAIKKLPPIRIKKPATTIYCGFEKFTLSKLHAKLQDNAGK
jgi:hypothetical protein